ncbi:MAG TPA: hypothetical protein VFS08_10800 [Gemmatimonadaceae bacterium]|nr:hypothetical protein [Gemmatimonadaceae bacterium]
MPRQVVGQTMCLGFVILIAGSGAAHSQRPAAVVIESSPSCPRCSLEVTRIATLGAAEDPSGLFHAFDLDHDGRGRFIAAPADDRSQFLPYDARGRLIRVVGRSGEGPGEFRGIFRVTVGPGDTLHVFDDGLARWTVLSPDLKLARTTRLPLVPQRAVLLRSDRLVVRASIPTRELAGLPLHLVGPDGRVVRSFGATDPEIRRDRRAASSRVIGRADDASVWSAYVDRYRIERWGIDGRLQLALTRQADWFPRWDDYTPRRLDERPPRPETRGVA